MCRIRRRIRRKVMRLLRRLCNYVQEQEEREWEEYMRSMRRDEERWYSPLGVSTGSYIYDPTDWE